MRKVLIADLARELENSTASIYQKIKSGTFKAEKINGKTYVILDDHIKKEEFKSASQDVANIEIEYLKELIKSKNAEIETLKISLQAFTMIFNRQIAPDQAVKNEPETVETEAFEADIETDQEVKKKRKKKKRSKLKN